MDRAEVLNDRFRMHFDVEIEGIVELVVVGPEDDASVKPYGWKVVQSGDQFSFHYSPTRMCRVLADFNDEQFSAYLDSLTFLCDVQITNMVQSGEPAHVCEDRAFEAMTLISKDVAVFFLQVQLAIVDQVGTE